MPATVLQLNKIYKANAPLINNMVKPDSTDFRTIACYLAGDSDGRNDMEARAAKTIYCGLSKKLVRWTRRATVNRVAEIIDQNEVDLVVCQFRRSIPIGVLAARRSRRKPRVVGVLHGIVGGKVGLGLRLVNFFAFRGLANIVSVSRAGMADIIRMNPGLDPRKLVAIPNGLDCGPFLAPPSGTRETVLPGCPREDFVFAMVGRLAPVKNHSAVLQAVARLRDEFPRLRLVIVGRGPLEAVLKAQVAKLKLADRVDFLGYRTDVPEILKQVDAYLMPSFREGFGLALAEAMVSGLPVIASGRGGMLELVPDRRYGLLVEPDSVESIASAMAELLSNSPQQNRELGERARARILEHYTAEKMAEAYEALYRQVLAA